jgi:hypothetical protein
MPGMPGMIIKRVLTLVAIILVLPYACSPIYRFPEPRVFAGGSS